MEFLLEANRVLIDIDQAKKSSIKSENLDIVLEFCSAFRRKDYIQLFILYKSLPRLVCYLVNFFIDIYRKQMIQILIWGLVFIKEDVGKTFYFIIFFLKIYSNITN